MNRKIAIFLSLVIAPGVLLAQENDLSYTYIEADFANLDIDGFDDEENLREELDDGDGWAIRGSFGFADNWFVFGNYSSTESDTGFTDDSGIFFPGDTDIERLDLGGGYHMPLNDKLDLVFRAAYTDIDIGNFDFGATGDKDFDDLNEDSSDGYFGDVGIRAQLTDWLEGSVGGRYTDIQDVDNISVFGNLLFEITPAFGINLGVDAGDELVTWVIGARFSFN